MANNSNNENSANKTVAIVAGTTLGAAIVATAADAYFNAGALMDRLQTFFTKKDAVTPPVTEEGGESETDTTVA